MKASKKKTTKKTMSEGLTRRDLLKASGMALGGLALGSALVSSRGGNARAGQSCDCPPGPECDWTDYPASQHYTYFQNLNLFYPFDRHTNTTVTPLGKNEMRITFMGSVIPMNMRKTQQEMSVFVEVGWDEDKEMPLDQFIFDCGTGVSTDYSAMNVSLGRMNKVFINHLHGDHMSDLTHIYCFGPCQDRKSPLYVFGPVLGGRSSRNPEILALFLVGMWNAGKGRDGEDEGTGKRMMKKASYGNVHVSQRPRILPGYPNHLSLRRGEKGQKFWSPKCRATYLSLARTIGR